MGKYPKSAQDESVRVAQSTDGKAYVSFGGSKAENQKALSLYGKGLTDANVVKANFRRDYSDLTTTSSGRPGLNHGDFDWFRPGQSAPTKPKEIIAFARYVYRRIGLIHNAMDLMGDFACQGVKLVHPNKTIENFYNNWFNQVKGKQVSERLGHLLFREANVPIRAYTAKINAKKRKEMQKTVADTELKIESTNPVFRNKELPWRYVFIDPLLIEPLGGALANLSNNPKLLLKIPTSLKMAIQKLKQSPNAEIQNVLKDISPDILKAAETGGSVLLPPEKTYLYHYKKDDWQTWADPITYSAFEPLNLYQRLQLADKAALDGAISKIRVWKLGSLEHKLAPTATASTALADMLGANVGGGTIDIIWGPDIELIETKTDVQAFLGDEKYKPTLMAIYATLGIPPTLTGTFGASGTTNNFISLKTLTERLNYVRDIIKTFWTEQIRNVQKAMGFRLPAQIQFDHMYLEDPAAVATLLLNMSDRNIVSEEFVQNYIKANPYIEGKRLKAEAKKRDRADMEKVSPYHTVDKDHELRKLSLQTGVAAPSQVGLELEDKKDGEKSALDVKEKALTMKPQGRPGETKKTGMPGRPKNSTDKVKRKEKTFKPKIKASTSLWARQAQAEIAEIMNPVLLSIFNKGSLRNLTAKEFKELEETKFEILCNLPIGSEINEKTLAIASQNPPKGIHSQFNKLLDSVARDQFGKLSIDQVRDLRISFYTDYSHNNMELENE